MKLWTDKEKYLKFYQSSSDETHEQIIKRLRNELKKQLGFIKWLFFKNEYNEIHQMLLRNDEQFIASMMKMSDFCI